MNDPLNRPESTQPRAMSTQSASKQRKQPAAEEKAKPPRKKVPSSGGTPKKRTPDQARVELQQTEERRRRHEREEEQEAPGPDRPVETDYLPGLAENLLGHVKRIPDEVVSSSNDCYDFSRACDRLSKIYRIASACIRTLVFRESWESAKQQTDARGAMPSSQSLGIARKCLIRSVLEHGDLISHNYRIAGKDNRLFDNIMSCIFTLDMVEFYSMSPEDRKMHEKFIADSDAYLVMNNVAVASDVSSVTDYKTPVLRYRMSQFVAAVYQLAASWTTLTYSKNLIYYLELLRIRMGQFINLSYGGKVHDVEALRAGEAPSIKKPDGEYQSSVHLVHIVAPVIADIMKRTVNFASHKMATEDQMRQLKGKRNTKVLIKKFNEWIGKKIKDMIPEGGSEILGRHLLEMNLRPGERAVYSREFPSGSNLTDVQFIMGRYRRNEFNYLSELKQKTFAQVIEKELPKQIKVKLGTCGHESPQLVLCLFELIEMYTKAAYFGRIDITNYIIFETQLESRASDFIYVEEPMIVQVFNYFQVYYRRRLYRFDSFIVSFLMWLKIIERDFKRKVGVCDLSGWFMEILGTEDPSVKFWEPPSIFGSDDEEEESEDSTATTKSQAGEDDGEDDDEKEKPKPKESGLKNKHTKVSDQDSLAIKSVM